MYTNKEDNRLQFLLQTFTFIQMKAFEKLIFYIIRFNIIINLFSAKQLLNKFPQKHSLLTSFEESLSRVIKFSLRYVFQEFLFIHPFIYLLFLFLHGKVFFLSTSYFAMTNKLTKPIQHNRLSIFNNLLLFFIRSNVFTVNIESSLMCARLVCNKLNNVFHQK